MVLRYAPLYVCFGLYITFCLVQNVNAFFVQPESKKLQYCKIPAGLTPQDIRTAACWRTQPLGVKGNPFRNASMGRPSGKNGRVTRLFKRTRRKRAFVALMAVLSRWIMQAAPAVASSTRSVARTTLPTQRLGVKELTSATIMALTVGGLGMRVVGLKQLSHSLVVACCRCTVQLFLVGALILSRLFGTTNPAIVMAWIVGVGCIAAYESWSRVEYTYPALQRHLIMAVQGGGLSVLSVALLCRVLGNLDPWFQPRTVIPVAGMIFGNTLSAASLGANALTREFVLRRDQLELRLARGATSEEAALPHLQTALKAALTPTINSLSITGIVHMPGMMSGQILAGQSPYQASVYQVVILFFITTSACAMVLFLSEVIKREMFDKKTHRLLSTHVRHTKRSQEMTSSGTVTTKKDSPTLKLSTVWRLVASFVGIRVSSNTQSQSMTLMESSASTVFNETSPADSNVPVLAAPTLKEIRQNVEPTNKGEEPVLAVDNLLVERPNNLTFSFTARKGDRVGVTGASGIGKTQLLRALAGLDGSEHSNDNGREILLNGKRSSKYSSTQWRRDVMWVPQDKPTLDGTPRDFYNQVRRYKSRHNQKNSMMTPDDYCLQWNLEPSALDQPWATLSGGEAQRASLALALSLNPKTLLLDESMGALDRDTASLVERTLADVRIPIVLVTHSREQLERFCTHHLNVA